MPTDLPTRRSRTAPEEPESSSSSTLLGSVVVVVLLVLVARCASENRCASVCTGSGGYTLGVTTCTCLPGGTR